MRINGAPGNTIGGTAAGAGNLISGNGGGVYVRGSGATGNKVEGNYIGTQGDGTSALGNTGHGVVISTVASDNTIGGTAAGAGNVIAFNGGDGVYVISGTGNLIDPNSIHSNTGLGIDLGTDGVTPNDPDDPDAGANNLQNFPVLTVAAGGPATTTIKGTLNSTASTTFTLEFFSNTACDPSGNGEGETFLDSTTETTNGSGDVSFTISVGTTVPVGEFITATATDPNDNTSEFSACEEVLLDSDGDGEPDTTDVCPNDANDDADGDGICVGSGFLPPKTGDNDNCPDTANADQENNVHPGTPEGDHCEDPEGDGAFDISDNCPDTANPGQENNDGDDLGDACDTCPDDSENDVDSDGVCAGTGFLPPKTGDSDNCPSTSNPGQENADVDGLGDACDNCPDTTNPGQENDVHPATPEGDHCEDPDGDGHMDVFDGCPDTATAWLTPIGDGDCDGFSSADEGTITTDPADPCANTSDSNDEEPDAWPPDFNDDRLINLIDLNKMLPPPLGAWGSSPGNPDPNGDGTDDWSPRRDLVIDGVINLPDLNKLLPAPLGTWGHTCTP